MGFIRRQEIQLAIKFLIWQYQKANIPVPEHLTLEQQASKIVDDAHSIARERGSMFCQLLKNWQVI
jgi:hypothetical protein